MSDQRDGNKCRRKITQGEIEKGSGATTVTLKVTLEIKVTHQKGYGHSESVFKAKICNSAGDGTATSFGTCVEDIQE